MEVAVLQADIDIATDGHIDTGDQLPRELAFAVAELVDVAIANTATGIAADPAVAA